MDSKGSVRVVLHNLELLERILQNLRGDKRTLLSASLVAKAFTEPALNVLWYEIHSIWPLFRILPTFRRGLNGKYVFTGPIRNEHLRRVFYYAKRIRFLHYMDTNEVLYSNAPQDLVVSTFMRLDKLGAFIPLRKVHLCGVLRNTMLLPLTSPNLDTIEIMTRMAQHEITEIGIASSLQAVAQSPLLKSLAIDGPFRDITLQVLPDFIHLHRLRICLDTPNISAYFLNRLASSMPSLEHLHVRTSKTLTPPQFDRPSLVQPPLTRLSFPSLKTLNVDCGATKPETLLGILDAPLLQSVSLSLFQSNHGASWMHQFIESNQQLIKDKVRDLVIKSFYPPISVVKSFENLKTLIVASTNSGISMTQLMYTFAYAGRWSRSLVHLELSQTNATTMFYSMSIAALYVIADACPNLKTLYISIHHPDKPEKRDGEGAPHGLETLVFVNLPGVWDDSITLAIELASLLEHVFPAMDVPRYLANATDMATRDTWWKGVQDMWRMCQMVKDRRNPLSG